MAEGSAELRDSRFYEAKYPAVDELVMVKVLRIGDMGVYVSLLEYGNIEGMILMSELSKRRFRSVNKLMRVGRKEVVAVVRVDAVKGYIDLSKRRVNPNDVDKCEERYTKAKMVQQVVRHAAHNLGKDPLEVNQTFVWPLDRTYSCAFDALKEAVKDPQPIRDVLKGVDPETLEAILKDVQARMAPNALKIRARIDVLCTGRDGVDAVKDALRRGREAANEMIEEKDREVQGEVRVKLVAPPKYVVVLTCMDKEKGVKRVETALTVIEATIRKYEKSHYFQDSEIQVIGAEEEAMVIDVPEESEEDEDEDEEEEEETMGLINEDDAAEVDVGEDGV